MIEEKRSIHFMGLSMLLGLFIPHTSTLLLIINPLLCLGLFLVFRNVNNNHTGTFGTVKFLMCGIVIVSLLYSVIFVHHSSIKYLFSSVFFFMLILLFPFAGNNSIPKGYYYVAMYYILFTQLLYVLNVPVLQKVIESWYPIREEDLNSFEYMTRTISTSNILNYRLGGLFRNPNQCSRYVCLITAAFLAERHNATMKNVIVMILLAVVSVVLTGSRTGLAVMAIIIGFFLYKNPTMKKSVKFCLLTASLVTILPMFIIGSEEIRGFNMSQGFNNSANVKLQVLEDYLTQDNSWFHLLFGYADIGTFRPSNYSIMAIFDSEYGNMIYCYGFLGLTMLIVFYIKSIKTCPKECRFYFFILLWSITSTVLMSYRMSFLFMFFLSHLVTLKPVSSNENR